MVNPFQYQLDGVAFAHSKNGRALIAFDMGLGKTAVSLWYAKENKPGRPIVVVCPANVKTHWQHEAFIHIGMRSEILQGKKRLRANRKSLARYPMLIINYEILAAWVPYLLDLDPQLVIIDECFPPDIPVLTDKGWIPIGKIVDEKIFTRVACCDPKNPDRIVYKPILQYIKKHRTTRLLKIEHSTGSLVVTENHKFWVKGKGYVKASSLTSGDCLQTLPEDACCSLPISPSPILQSELFCKCGRCNFGKTEKEKTNKENMRMVREEISNARCQRNKIKKILQQKLFGLLAHVATRIQRKNIQQSRTESKNIGITQEISSNKRRIKKKKGPFQTDETTQSNEYPRNDRQSKSHQEEERYFECVARDTGRQRDTDNPTNQISKSVGNAMENRTRYSNKTEESLSPQLQSGHRAQEIEDWNRNRWDSPQTEKNQITRQEETKVINISWLDDTEIHKSEDRHQTRLGTSSNQIVYNLTIADHHNYFVLSGGKGILVSNCHRIKSLQSQCSKAIRVLCENVPHILALGGTPLENRPTELWNICNILQPKHKKFRSYWKFGLEFSTPVKTRGRWTFKGAKNTKRLHRLLTRTIMIRRLKEDVLEQLPKKTRIVLPVEMDNYREYEQAKHNFKAWLRQNKPSKARKASRQGWKAQQMTQLGYLKQLAAKLKLKAVTDWIDNYFEETDKKLVLFAIHHEIVDQLKERYKGMCVTLTGKTSKRDRLSAVEQFVKDKKIRLFIGNVQAAGTGVNGLQHATDTSLTIELDWRSTVHDQADKRLDRLGQTLPVTCFYIVAKNSIEELLCEIQQDKRQMLGAVLDGKENNGTELDIFDQLCQALEKEK